MKLLFALLLVSAALVCGAETRRDAKLVDALAQAEKFAAAENWRDALDAGNRLRTLCREQHGDEHPDSALAELFLGEVRDHLGDHQLAEAHVRRALAIQEKVLPSEAPERVTTLTRLAALLKNRQAYDEAAGLLQRALDLHVKIRGADDSETAVAITNLARIVRMKREYERAAVLLEQSLAIQRHALGGTAPGTIDGLRELAQVQELAGKFAAAELTAAERVAAAEERFGAQSAELISALSDWGRFADDQLHFAEAEARYRRALKIGETVFANDDPALAGCLTQLGWCLRNLDRYDEAQPLLRRALVLRLRAFGLEHADTATSFRNLGWILRLKHDFETAEPLFEKALDIREHALGANDPLTIESISELGDLLWLRGDFDEAALLLEERRNRVEKISGAASEAAAAAWHGLAVIYESAKRWPEALEAVQHSLRLIEQQRGEGDPQTLGEVVVFARICTAAGAPAEALPHYVRLLAWFGQHPEGNWRSRVELLRQYAIATLRAGKADEAAPIFLESRRVHEAVFGASDPATLRSIGDLWTYYDETRQPVLALEVARELAARTETALGSDAVETSAVFDRLGQLCLSLGDASGAMKEFRRALDGRRRHFGDGSGEMLEALAQVAGRFENARDFAAATSLRTERLGMVERKFGRESEAAAAACGDLAWCYFRQRDLVSARGMFERQFVLNEKRSGAESVETLTAAARLGDVALAEYDWSTALKMRERLASGCARHYGHDHLETGRALLLLGEALLASSANTRAEANLRKAQRVIRASGAAPEGIAARAACALARAALRRDDVAGAKALTRDALAAPLANEEPLAEAFSLLGEEWSRAGDDAQTESTWTVALRILTQTAGDHDEHTLALLERVAVLQLRLGRAGPAALLERALAASEAVNGAGTPPTANVLGWLALARVQEGRCDTASEAAQRFLSLVQNTGGDADPRFSFASELAAWTAWRAADSDTTWARFAGVMLERWSWISPLSECVAHAVAEARMAAAP